MTNDELKKKIIHALWGNIEYELRDYPDDNCVEVVFNYEAIADALLAAGIGDVKEAEKNFWNNHASTKK